MEFPKRKHPRLKKYDYSQNGCYFVTVCTKERRRLLSTVVVGRDDHIPPTVHLTAAGKTVDKYICGIETAYDTVFVDSYIIMPDHIHLLIRVDTAESGGMRSSRPTVSTVIRSLKTMVTREIGRPIWQDSFYDHVVRNETEYLEIGRYMEENPAKWVEIGKG